MGMEQLLNLTALLPKYAELEELLKNENEASYILGFVTNNINNLFKNHEITPSNATIATNTSDTEEASYLIECFVDKIWERIHTGHFSAVPMQTRKLYTIANFFKIFYRLRESLDITQLEKCNEIFDEGLLLGCTQNLYVNSKRFEAEITTFLNERLDTFRCTDLPYILPIDYQKCPCDISQVVCPSVDVFRDGFFVPQKPVLLLNTIGHWPALHKWRDLNYILKVAGNRTVPVEIGSNYATDDWSQQLVKIRDFLERQFCLRTAETDIEYLAQHELFDQIPILKDDIRVPDYCSLGTEPEQVNIKAWLGPEGTISPMHYDAKHNILCQVFGSKKIILASPADSEYLYPHDTEFLHNTSQIEAEQLDLTKFPLVSKVKFLHATLQEGECLYIPPKWWHYVKSLNKSFSVSFWWE